MFNIIIVDDQKQIRDGLQTMLSQFSLPFDNIYSAANGLEAKKILQQQSIQLVITDIKMPDMDGLELMAYTKEERYNVDFLIISGYSDFAYAQKAISLGAKGYLLKPVKRDDLQTAVEHILQEITTRQALWRNMKDISRREKETDKKELSMYMKGAIYDDTWIRDTQQQTPELWSNYRLCLLREQIRINQPGASSSEVLESIIYSVYGKRGYLCLQNGPYLIVAVNAAIDVKAVPNALKTRQLDTASILTEPQKGLKKLQDSYNQVMELYRHSYLFPNKSLILTRHIEGLEQQWQLPYENLYSLFQMIGTTNSGYITEGISMLFHRDILQRYHIRYTQQLCRAIVQMLEECVLVIRPYIGEDALDIDSLRNLYDYHGIREYIQALQQQLLHLNQFYYEFKCSYRNSQDLNEAIRFIYENYHRPIDLAMVSNHVSLNYAYFSNLFKKNIGKGFAEYLRDVRLDKARKLLAETEYKIIEVASMVGYESYKSFTRAFREVMNMQPTEYRQMMRQKVEIDEKNQDTAL